MSTAGEYNQKLGEGGGAFLKNKKKTSWPKIIITAWGIITAK